MEARTGLLPERFFSGSPHSSGLAPWVYEYGPVLDIMLCYHHLESLNNLDQGVPHCHFATGPNPAHGPLLSDSGHLCAHTHTAPSVHSSLPTFLVMSPCVHTGINLGQVPVSVLSQFCSSLGQAFIFSVLPSTL